MRKDAPYVVVLSSHPFADLSEVVVAPVVRPGLLEPSAFDIEITFAEGRYIVSIIGLAAIRCGALRARAGSMIDHEYDIRRALDRLFTGF